ncbi:hypothetical protein [Pseudogemmobacter faecipullorum]|uniref:Uncharacterized protein n=1 Tax=Pseudogemmobacter faecipullorum TaxID=2755041 RepID=A0ABS8CQY2_9RHOB|nr:hypothetical protein [Pseudogemmobacter faecipullorum]MCB5411817.1 hypothetical protein [Pseudogemmobacter faecipullorum]
MNDMSPIAGLGHNHPPGPSLPEDLQAKLRDFLDAGGAWLDLKEIETTEQSQKAADFVTGARTVFKAIEAERVAQKKPHDDAGKAVQAFFTPFLDKIDRTADAVKKLQAAFLKKQEARAEAERRERERKAREEAEAAERARAEAEVRNDISGMIDAEEAAKAAAKEAKAAAAPVQVSAQSATGAGRTMSLRKTYSCTVVQRGPALAHFRDHPEVIALIERLATAEVRAQKGEKVAPNGFRLNVTETAA